jgi:Na+-transporting NADH:ubiquinone oxidoreductase subunit A
MIIRIDAGLDIPIGGAPAQVISPGPDVKAVAILGGDYHGLSPIMHVEEGDRVRLGQPLFADRKHPDILFTAPAAGIVAEINRGARRALLSVVLRRNGDDAESFPSWSAGELAGLPRDRVAECLLASGLWTAIRARPYGKLADPTTTPHSIFVTAVDSNPLAPQPELVIGEHPADFANGLTVLSRLTDGTVFLCTGPGADPPLGDSDRIFVTAFSGPHPSGLAGTHIHHLDPVHADKTVWHLGYQDVIAIGKLFTSGSVWTERVIALAGPMVRSPRLIRTRLGADIDDLTRDELTEGAARVISGSVLGGRRARRPETYLGRYHSQVSVVAEAEAAGDGFSTFDLLAPRRSRKRAWPFTTAVHGRPTALIPFGQFERVMPLDILPTPLLRALLVGDTDTAQALGCLELDEEDLALCSFVCPGKLTYGPLLRDALDRIEKEG